MEKQKKGNKGFLLLLLGVVVIIGVMVVPVAGLCGEKKQEQGAIAEEIAAIRSVSGMLSSSGWWKVSPNICR